MNAGGSLLELLPNGLSSGRTGRSTRQVADLLRACIASGSIVIGAELPKEAEIAERLGVSLITVRQALRDLASDGLIRKRSAKPAIVVSRTPTLSRGWNFENFADVAAFTKDAQLLVSSFRKETAPELGRHFGLDARRGRLLPAQRPGGGRRRRWRRSPPIFRHRSARAFARRISTDVLIFQSVQRRLGLRLDVAHVTVRAELASRGLAADLDVDVGSAVLAVEMLYQAAGRQNIELSIARHPAHLFSITYDLINNLT